MLEAQEGLMLNMSYLLNKRYMGAQYILVLLGCTHVFVRWQHCFIDFALSSSCLS